MQIKRIDIHEERVWCVECPECGGNITIEDDPYYEEECLCTDCGIRFEIED